MKGALGIIAGSGHLPALVVEACVAAGRPFFIITFNEPDSKPFAHHPHAVMRLGAVGDTLARLRQERVQEIVMIGGMKRPALTSLRPDAAGAQLLAKLGKAFFQGDDALLGAVVTFFEEEAFTVVGVESILGGIVTPEGVLGAVQPSTQAQKDYRLGLRAARQIGSQDIGQAVMVEHGDVLGVEDEQGTDALITRCAPRRQHPAPSGVLIKAKKPQQETRVDLPAIGTDTIEKLHAHGFAGVAVEAGASLLIHKASMIDKANAYGLFVVGVRHD